MKRLFVAALAVAGAFAFMSEASATKMTQQQVRNVCGSSLQTGGTPNGDTAMGCEKKCGGKICTYGCLKRKGKQEQCSGEVVGLVAQPGGKFKLPASLGPTQVFAARVGGGGGVGAGFSCNEPDNPGKCSCMGPIDSQDCKDMAKNCDGEISCGWLVDNCTCKHKSSVRVGSQIKTNFSAPKGGLLEANPGAPAGGTPAPTGTPVAPTAPPPVKIN